METTDFSAQRLAMIEGQLRPNGISHPVLLARFMAVEREHFAPVSVQPHAYDDQPMPLGAAARAAFPPLVLARLLVALGDLSAAKVLVVGAGSGYETLLLAGLAAQVVAVEDDDALAELAMQAAVAAHAENVTVLHGALPLGAAGSAPYDVVFVAVPHDAFPPALLAQVKEGGLVAGIRTGAGHLPQGFWATRKGNSLDVHVLFETEGVTHPALKEGESFVF